MNTGKLNYYLIMTLGTSMGVWCEGTWYLIRFSTWRCKSTNLPTLTYYQWVLLRWETHAKFEVSNPCGSLGHQARGLDGPNHKGLSDRVGGTLEYGCYPPRTRTLQNQTKVDDAVEAVVKTSHIRE